MFNAFSTALSGMTATAAAVNIISNNLANLNTTGFKPTTAGFQEMMAQSLGAGSSTSQVGMGVGPVSTSRVFTQGAVQVTGGTLDAAIDGDGFFVVNSPSGETLFTRDGNFKVDSSGQLVNFAGDKVQGWNGVAGVINPNGPTGDITIPGNGLIPGTATTKMSMSVNLDATAAVGAGGAFSAPIQIVDSLGVSHVLTATYTKTAPNAWDYSINIPQADLATGGVPQVAHGSLAFDGSGQLTTPAPGSAPISLQIAGLADHARDMTIDWSVFGASGSGLLTQFAQKSAVSTTTQDGTAPGQIIGISLQDGGLIVAKYSNGERATVAQLALASIQNPDSLASVGQNNLQLTAASAAPVIGAPDTGGRGKIVGGALEASSADIAREFTNLITVQRSYQANSKIVTAEDQLLQETISLIR